MKRHIIFSALVLWLMVLACGGSAPQPVEVGGPPPISVGGHTIDIKALYDKANNYYHEGVVSYEAPLMKLDAAYKAADNEFRLGVRDQMTVASYCFKNVADTESQIVDAALGNMEPGQLVNALVTNNLTGEQATTECTQIYRNIADYAATHRAAISQAWQARFALAVDYEVYFASFIEVDIMNDLMLTYGDSTLVYQKLADAGIPGITDWSWLPTTTLVATHNDAGVCNYYSSGRVLESLPMATRLKFKGHETAIASLYEATWIAPEDNGGQVGLCTMYRWAALRWFKRDVLSQETRDVQDSGVDAGAIPTLAP